MNKKGTALEGIAVICFGLVFAVLFLYVAQTWGRLSPNLVNTNGALTDVSNAVNSFDGYAVQFIIGAFVISVILAYLNKVTAVFAGVALIVWLITTIIAVKAANAWANLITTVDPAVQAHFSQTTALWQHMPLISAVTFACILVALYMSAKT